MADANVQLGRETRRTRGRPKGTGIDDGELLGRVSDLLRRDRDLKPTTAIRRIGISDPSIIRRLRDKMRSGGVLRADGPTRLASASLEPTAGLGAIVAPDVATELPVAARAPTMSPAPTDSIAPRQETEQEKRTRSALLLAAYLEALAKSEPQRASEPLPARVPDHSAAATVTPGAAEPQAAQLQPTPPKLPPAQPPPVQAPPSRAAEPAAGAPFHFPGMPSFLQPFRPPVTAPPAQGAASQLEGMKLAVEAMTSMAKLQLHLTENAMAYSPMALMLQGQAFVGQMLLASFTGQLDAVKKKPADGK